MSGSKMKKTTTEAMRHARNVGKSKTDWQRVRAAAAANIEPEEDVDSPDATSAMRKEIIRRGAGRPAGSGTKQQIAIRLDSEIIEAFRQSGAGWQTRINDVLKSWLADHPNKI